MRTSEERAPRGAASSPIMSRGAMVSVVILGLFMLHLIGAARLLDRAALTTSSTVASSPGD